MTIERTREEIIFRIPKNTKIEDLQELADLFEFKKIAQKSKATQSGLDSILEKSKKGRWKMIQNKLSL